ncbi:MAG: alanine:cation symporter family protein, partial [Oscillospiraceae bacterium]|nr:alanine:cation symporter family protein [Oscillospiraceae bacterium]
LSSGIFPSEELSGAPFVQTALASNFGNFGAYFVTFSLLLFAFTTLIGNLFYCEGALNYIAKRTVGKIGMTIFRVLACVVVFVGALLEFGMVWNLADVLMGIMAIINLPVIVILGKPALAALKDYVAQRKAGKDPEFKAASVGLKTKTDFWN